MKYALVNDQKTEATKNARGICQGCDSELIAKCGEFKVHHWSHKGNRICDKWWENETEWHRSWKDNFPKEIQEIVHFDETGEKHIADVKTDNGWIIEFQHSFLDNVERQSRKKFYKKLIWVVDGTRRKNDKKQFFKFLESGRKLHPNVPIIQLRFIDECKLVKEWYGDSLVFFDFKELGDVKDDSLWFLFPKFPSGNAYISWFSRSRFVELFRNDGFDEFFNNIIKKYHDEIKTGESKKRRQSNIASTFYKAQTKRRRDFRM